MIKIYKILLVLILLPNALFASENYIVNYDNLLSKYVSKAKKENIILNVVDYKNWSKDKNHSLALNSLLANDHLSFEGDKKKAFWINAYNLLTIDLIIKTNEQESIKNQGSLFQNVWKKHEWQFVDKTYTLHQIEHDILRLMGDPRIHMAINCASISCPDINNTSYNHEVLDRQLDVQSKLFIKNKGKGVSLTANKNLKISKIFDWFQKDFGGKEGVKRFIKGYDYGIASTDNIEGHIEYNWNLNSKN